MHNASTFFVLLEFADKTRAGQHIDGHNAWIDQGFDDDAFSSRAPFRAVIVPSLSGTRRTRSSPSAFKANLSCTMAWSRPRSSRLSKSCHRDYTQLKSLLAG